MLLLLGLGNSGKKYEKSRHNLGFRVVDAFAAEYNAEFEFKKKLQAEVAKAPPLKVRGGGGELFKIILAKPQTFMNDSGKALRKLATSYRLQAASLLVVHDDVDLPFGKIRLSQNSGSAGHKGVESIIQAIGKNFTRLRIGIENREKLKVPDTETYVLQNFTAEEERELKKDIIPQALEEIQKFHPLLSPPVPRRGIGGEEEGVFGN